MNILVLYSWEDNYQRAQEWAMALCLELQRYESVTAECDMLFLPQSDRLKEIRNKILSADKILVVLTKSYIEKIESKRGTVSFEENLYKERIDNDTEENRIAFVLKEKNITPPKEWEAFERFDLSDFNEFNFRYLTQREIQNRIAQIVRFYSSTPEYTLPNNLKRRPLPKTKRVLSFNQILKPQNPNELSLHDQERRLIQYITKNSNQDAFAYQYIKSGLSADSNLGDRMTPELFIKHFLVKRTDIEEDKYNNTIKTLFDSDHHNMFCLQSDGGSGKSIFIQTLGYKNEHKVNKKNVFTNTIFDLSNLSENNAEKEEIVFQKLKKIYRQMLLNSPDPDFFQLWRNNFIDKVNELKSVEFLTTDLFDLSDFQIRLNSFLDIISPCSEIEDWYSGYSRRLRKAKNQEQTNILFVILLVTYLFILDCKPIICNKEERYTLVFDNIETYDNGEIAKNISVYIEKCYAFIKKIFTDIGLFDDFFKKFTFVFVLRTSTLIHFGNLQGDIWGSGTYIKHLSFFDFTTEALIKKLLFLKNIKNYENTVLYKKMYQFLSIIIPEGNLKTIISSQTNLDPSYRYFTTHRLLPLFNNNFRRAIGYLNRSVLSDDNYEMVEEKIQSLNRTGQMYDFGINGIRMKIFREVFNSFQLNGYFAIMHFNDTVGNNCSVTRMILSFLYWDELYYISQNNKNEEYIGISLYEMIKIFEKFWNIKQISKTLFGLSILSNKSPAQKEVLNAWGHLLVYNNLYVNLVEYDFYLLIEKTAKQRKTVVNINKTDIDTSKIFVKLSDAGMCFVQYYIRSFEFIMARSNMIKTPPLFFIKEQTDALQAIANVFNNLKKCIKETMAPCKSNCKLYNITKKGCFAKCTKSKNRLFRCPLFLRYQECLDLIRESIWYIDRYRIFYYNEHEDLNYNSQLLDFIKQYYSLYYNLKEYVLNTLVCKENIIGFVKLWDYPNNKQFVNLLSEEQRKTYRTEIVRPIQSYFARQDENMELVLSNLANSPRKTIYQSIIDLSNSTM